MSPPDMTDLLQRLSSGDKGAEAELIPQIYQQLRKIAAAYLKNERSDHTLQPTALVNEAYIRLSEQRPVAWQSRAHFFAVAATVMRHILVDSARRKRSTKRGSGHVVQLDENLDLSDQQSVLVDDLDEALERLKQLNSRQARIVEMRFFGGMTEEEIGEVLGISARTVKRDWTAARAWLYGELMGGEESLVLA
jgi:RNA polymerase sigma-70 factor (ECF subfamily)